MHETIVSYMFYDHNKVTYIRFKDAVQQELKRLPGRRLRRISRLWYATRDFVKKYVPVNTKSNFWRFWWVKTNLIPLCRYNEMYRQNCVVDTLRRTELKYSANKDWCLFYVSLLISSKMMNYTLDNLVIAL